MAGLNLPPIDPSALCPLPSAFVQAHKGREQAQKTLMAFAAIGIRTWIQQELDWHPNQKTTEFQDLSEYEAFRLNVKMQNLDEIVRTFVDGCSTGRLDQLEKGLKREIADRQREVGYLKVDLDNLKVKHGELQRKFDCLLCEYKHLLLELCKPTRSGRNRGN